jgi:hypothetical protein
VSWVPACQSGEEEQPPKRLSILICSLKSREIKLQRLLETFTKQLTNEVEVLHYQDEGEITIGAKRNELLEMASGEYCAFVDDDDMVSDDYISKVLTAIESKPDCTSLTGIIYFPNGASRMFDHSIQHDGWFTGPDGNFYRTPNHLNPIKTEIAKRFGFKDINNGEDYDFSQRIRYGLHSEVRIPGEIYYYYPNASS